VRELGLARPNPKIGAERIDAHPAGSLDLTAAGRTDRELHAERAKRPAATGDRGVDL
jgi:hypothetical protein